MRAPPMLLLACLLLAGCSTTSETPASVPSSAPPAASAAPPPEPAHGESRFHEVGACVADACAPFTDWRWGSFEARGPGILNVTWTPANPTMQTLRVSLATQKKELASATGESPLSIPLASLPPGTYEVRVRPDAPSTAPMEQVVDWTFALT